MNKTKGKHFAVISAMRGMTIIAILSVIGFGFIGCKEEPDDEAYVDQDGFRFYQIEGGAAYSIAGLSEKNVSSEANFNIPDKVNGVPVTAIRENAFNGFIHLETIIIPNSITTIGNYAFQDCRRLKNITIPDSVTSMGRHTFHGCLALETVEIGDGVTSIGNETFYGCTKLEDITIGSSVTAIGDRAFQQCTSLEYITIPNSVTAIGNSAFRLCTSIASITIPGSVTTMGADVFKDCTGLLTIHVQFAESNIPAGWDQAWSGVTIGGTLSIQYSIGYTAAANNSTDTTAINFTFTSSVTGLLEGDITITDGTGTVTKGALTGSGTSWAIGITVITAGDVTVSINKAGIESGSKTVAVATSSAPPPPPITYSAAADSDTDTTAIDITFLSSVTGLVEGDITITDGTGTVTKGALTGSGTSWAIGITVITAGDVTVSINKAGIESGSKTVTVAKI